ncbi:hypothetical protein [Hyphomicrobium facile]|uniref:Uncharacterized protein n=1 Tax=Hyphomicrobium facile TaxID=51670 RepID=A0A1I7NW40_9HYPH|nr:hypothetical protein [Hyphomicrobium facile]SFV38881.1 hypothetical protein SAMN04488557_3897 [Hyphomicrobium facile]
MKMIGHVLRRASLQIATALALAPFTLVPAPAFADEPQPQQAEWPCIYRKVPVLTAATIWDGPAITDTSTWRKDETIRKLSQYLVSRRVKENEVEAAVKKFAAGLPADTHDAKLTELFSAVLTRTNEDRKVVMSGIERFHKRQLERAKEIEKEGVELPPSGDFGATDAPAGEISQLSPVEEKYKWEVRTFQEKQANIPIACEIPQLIDERAGVIARAIRAEMKS